MRTTFTLQECTGLYCSVTVLPTINADLIPLSELQTRHQFMHNVSRSKHSRQCIISFYAVHKWETTMQASQLGRTKQKNFNLKKERH